MKTFKIGPKTRAELEHKRDVARDTASSTTRDHGKDSEESVQAALGMKGEGK